MYKKISGIVLNGKKLGRTIDFPTANISCDDENIFDGTYRINVVVNGKKYSGVGAYLREKKLFESHIFNFSEDIYGTKIEVYILYKIRDNEKFFSFEELKDQILKDVEYAKSHEIIAMTFGTFDVFHEGHKHYLGEAKNFSDKLITIVATDKNVFKIKGFLPKFNENDRKTEVEKSGISNQVFVGNEENPMYFVEKFKPNVICLGYDQRGFSEMLETFLKEKNIETEIIRIESFKPEIYKSSILKNNNKYEKNLS